MAMGPAAVPSWRRAWHDLKVEDDAIARPWREVTEGPPGLSGWALGRVQVVLPRQVSQVAGADDRGPMVAQGSGR